MLTPEEIAYIREWAASGNKPRPMYEVARFSARLPVAGAPGMGGNLSVRLTTHGLTIAALTDALEQANETADFCQIYIEPYFRKKHSVDEDLETMRTNRAKFLGDI